MLLLYRQQYDAFLVVHGTDTLAYTASALSLMLLGFRWAQGSTAAVTLLCCLTCCILQLTMDSSAALGAFTMSSPLMDMHPHSI